MNITKLISTLISLCFLHSFVVAPTVQATLEADLSLSGAQPEFEKLFMPSSAGRITASHDFGTKTVVINIQDFHCHPEVQRNISRILESLDRKFRLNEVYVEGGYGDVDTSWLAAYPDVRAKRGIADALVNGGRLTGSEYYSIVADKPLLLKGLEDEQLHRENVARLGKILSRQGSFDATVRQLDKDIAFLQAKYLNTRNRKLNTIIEEHKAGKLSSEKYYLLLMKYADAVNARPDDFNALIPPRRENYPNIVRYLETLECSRRLRYARISGQLQACVRELKSVLPYSRYQQLLTETGNFSDLEKLYVAINTLVRENRIRISGKYPDLQDFLSCTDKSRSINPVLLLGEEKQLVESLRVALSEDRAEVQVSFLVDFYGTLRDYLSQKLTADDYEYFVSRVDRFRELWAKYTYVNHLNAIDEELPLLDDYYRANVQRNYAFIDHLFKPEEAAAAGQEQGKVLVTVTGGFHSEGLQRLLEEKKISYVTITPHVTADIGQAGAVYLDLIRSQAKEFNANALAARLGSSSGAKIIPDAADARIFKVLIGENAFIVRRADNGKYHLEDKQGADSSKEYFELKEAISDALKMAAQIEKTVNPLRTAELINELVIIADKWAAERGIIAGHGLIFEIAMDNDVQEALTEHQYSDALPQLELDEIARLPDNLQQTYVNGVLRQEKREEWQKEGKELLVAVSMVPGLRNLLLAEETSSASRNEPLFNGRLLFSTLPLPLIYLAGNADNSGLSSVNPLLLAVTVFELAVAIIIAAEMISIMGVADIMKDIRSIGRKARGMLIEIEEQGLSTSAGKFYSWVKNGVTGLYRDALFVLQNRIEKYKDRRDPVKRQQRQQRLKKLVNEEAAELILNAGKNDTNIDELTRNIYFGRPFAELRAYWRESIWDYILLAALVLQNIVDFNNYAPAVLLLIPVVKTIHFRRDAEAKIIGRKAIFFRDSTVTDETLTRTFIVHELTHRIFPKRRQAYLASYFEYLKMQELGKETKYSHAASEVRSLLEHPGKQDLKNVDTMEKAILRRAKGYVSQHGLLERLVALHYEPIYTYYYGHMMAAYVVDQLFKGDIRKAYLVGQYLGEGAKFSDAVRAAGYVDTSEPKTHGIRDRLPLVAEKGKQAIVIILQLAMLSLLLYIMAITPSIGYGIVLVAFIVKDVKYLSMMYDLDFGDILVRFKNRIKDLTSGGGSLFSVLPLPLLFLAANAGGAGGVDTNFQTITINLTVVVELIVVAVQLGVMARVGVFRDIKSLMKRAGSLVIEAVKQGPSASAGKLYGWMKGRATAAYNKIAVRAKKPVEKFRDMRDPVKRHQKLARYERYNQILLEEAARIISINGVRGITPDALVKDIYFGQLFKALRTNWRANAGIYFLLASMIIWSIADYGNYTALAVLISPVLQSVALFRNNGAMVLNSREIFFLHPDTMNEVEFRNAATHELTHRLLRKKEQTYLASYFGYLRERELGDAPDYSFAASDISSVVTQVYGTYGQNADAAAGEILRTAKKNTSRYNLLMRVRKEYGKEPLYTYEYAQILAAYVVDCLCEGSLRKANLVGRYLGEGYSLNDAVQKAGGDITLPAHPDIRAGERQIRAGAIGVILNLSYLALFGSLIFVAVTNPSIWFALTVLSFINVWIGWMRFANDWRLRDIPGKLWHRVQALIRGKSMLSALPFPLIFMAANSSGAEWGFTDNVKLVAIISLLGAVAWTSYQILFAGKSRSTAAKRKAPALEARREGGGAIVKKLAARINTKSNRYIAKTIVQSTLLGLLLQYILDIPLDGLVLILSGIVVMKFQDVVRNVRKYFAVYKEMRDPVKKRKSQEVNDRLVTEAVTNMIKLTRRTDEDPATLKKSIYVNRPFIELKAYWKSRVLDMAAVASVMLWSLSDQGNLNSDIVTVVPLMLIQSIKLLTDYLTPFGRMGSNINNTALFVVAPYGRDEAKISGYITHEIAHTFFPKKNVMYLGRYFQYLRWKQLGKDNIYSTASNDVQEIFSDGAVTDSQSVEEVAAEILRRAQQKAKSYGLLARISAAWTEPKYNYPYGEMMAYYVVEYLFHGEVEKAYEVGTYLGQGDTLRDALIKAKYNGQALAGNPTAGKRSVAEKGKIVKAVSSALYLTAPGLLLISLGLIILMMGNPGTWGMIAITATMIAGLTHLKYVNNWEPGKVPAQLKGMVKNFVKIMKSKSFTKDEEASFSFLGLSTGKTRSPAGILTHYLPGGSDLAMQMRSLDTTASNRVAGPLQFIILPLSREEMGDGWENTGVNAGDNKPVWIKAYNGVVVFTAEDAAPSMIAQALRERLSPSGRFAADKDLVSHLDKILSGAGIPVPQVYDLSIVVDHADTETPAVTSLEEIIISGKEYADRISAGRTPAQILAEIRERKITAQRQSKEKLYFNDSSKTLEGLLGNMKLLKGSNSGNLIVQPEIFNGLPGEGKQEAINKAGEYMKDLHITLFVDLSGREDQKEVLETEKQQYRDAGFSGYVTGTRTPGNTISIHWFEKPDGEKLVEANAALEESYEDLTALQGALKSALADAGSFVFDLDRIQKTLGKDRDVEMQVALQGLLNDLFKDDPDYLQAQIEKQMKGLDPQKLQRILSAA